MNILTTKSARLSIKSKQSNIKIDKTKNVINCELNENIEENEDEEETKQIKVF